MATFVLVHGSYAGGWMWGRLRSRLEAAGHRVYAPSLTGLGDRHHLAGPEIGLATHVQDITNLLVWEDITDAVLVGNSYGGMVISGVAERVPERAAHLVFVSAFVPYAGRSAFELIPEVRDIFAFTPKVPDWAVAQPTDPASIGAGMGVSDPDDQQWMASRLVPMLRRTHEDTLGAGMEKARSALPCTYVHCTEDHMFDPTATYAAEQGFRIVTIDGSGHVPMISHPDELAEHLVDLAPGRVEAFEGGER
ncbi:alpha/beta fold hydrolase [Nocardia transvalensis]|uniref:alpha/beta fold hydrolase n=1 Tax=Nocardia transvalensis TaxID=37333 RepID=UPI00189454AA|nr:alpha/beta hydrolase [Nocardia transvalensis]MBF6332226.1 alpha/beta hydrolase [Nocardia transvalensis]